MAKKTLTAPVVTRLYKALDITKDQVKQTNHFEAKDGKDEMFSFLLTGHLGKGETITGRLYAKADWKKDLIFNVTQRVKGVWQTAETVAQPTSLDEAKTLINSLRAFEKSSAIDMSEVL